MVILIVVIATFMYFDYKAKVDKQNSINYEFTSYLNKEIKTLNLVLNINIEDYWMSSKRINSKL